MAFSCPKDTSNLTLEFKAKVGEIKEDIQDNKDNIKGLQGTMKQVKDPTNLALHNGLETLDNKESVQDKGTEILELETIQELHQVELRSLEEQIRNRETSLVLQERELQSEL